MSTHVNMLPTDFQRRQHMQLCLRRWALPWLFVSSLLAAAVLVEAAVVGDTHSALRSAMDREQSRLAKLSKQLTEARLQLADMKSQECLVSQLDNQPPELLAVAMVSRAAGQCEGTVQIRDFVLQRKEEVTSDVQDATRETVTTTHLLTLKGAALDNHCVARLTAALREINLFTSVKLKSSGAERLGDQEVASYLLECVF